MKIFDWVHRKFRQNNGQGVKDSYEVGKAGHRLSEKQFRGHNSPSGCGWRWTRSLTEMTSGDEGEAHDAGLSKGGETAMGDLPEAFLTIGTLGLPTYDHQEEEEAAVAVAEVSQEFQNLVERVDSEVTPVEVEIFHDQLEKAFGLKNCSNNNYSDDSTVDCDSVRASKADGDSTQTEKDNVNVYPLHEFFHSPMVEPPPPRANKKESRISLEDLFSSTKQQVSSARPSVSKEDQTSQPSYKKPKDSTVHKHGGGSKKAIKRSDQQVESCCKLDKVIGLFQRKIHPDETGGCEIGCVDTARLHGKVTSSSKFGSKNKKFLSRLTNCILPRAIEDDGHMEPGMTDRNHELCSRSGVLCTEEHWIRTDAEYVVLEL